MLPLTSMEISARVFCDREWPRHLNARRADGMQMCPVNWLLPDLLALIAENHDRPVRELQPMIRRLIEEHDFFDDAGDSMVETDRDELIDDYADLFVKALERVRRQALKQGEWSNLPVTPQMFG